MSHTSGNTPVAGHTRSHKQKASSDIQSSMHTATHSANSTENNNAQPVHMPTNALSAFIPSHTGDLIAAGRTRTPTKGTTRIPSPISSVSIAQQSTNVTAPTRTTADPFAMFRVPHSPTRTTSTVAVPPATTPIASSTHVSNAEQLYVAAALLGNNTQQHPINTAATMDDHKLAAVHTLLNGVPVTNPRGGSRPTAFNAHITHRSASADTRTHTPRPLDSFLHGPGTRNVPLEVDCTPPNPILFSDNTHISPTVVHNMPTGALTHITHSSTVPAHTGAKLIDLSPLSARTSDSLQRDDEHKQSSTLHINVHSGLPSDGGVDSDVQVCHTVPSTVTGTPVHTAHTPDTYANAPSVSLSAGSTGNSSTSGRMPSDGADSGVQVRHMVPATISDSPVPTVPALSATPNVFTAPPSVGDTGPSRSNNVQPHPAVDAPVPVQHNNAVHVHNHGPTNSAVSVSGPSTVTHSTITQLEHKTHTTSDTATHDSGISDTQAPAYVPHPVITHSSHMAGPVHATHTSAHQPTVASPEDDSLRLQYEPSQLYTLSVPDPAIQPATVENSSPALEPSYVAREFKTGLLTYATVKYWQSAEHKSRLPSMRDPTMYQLDGKQEASRVHVPPTMQLTVHNKTGFPLSLHSVAAVTDADKAKFMRSRAAALISCGLDHSIPPDCISHATIVSASSKRDNKAFHLRVVFISEAADSLVREALFNAKREFRTHITARIPVTVKLAEGYTVNAVEQVLCDLNSDAQSVVTTAYGNKINMLIPINKVKTVLSSALLWHIIKPNSLPRVLKFSAEHYCSRCYQSEHSPDNCPQPADQQRCGICARIGHHYSSCRTPHEQHDCIIPGCTDPTSHPTYKCPKYKSQMVPCNSSTLPPYLQVQLHEGHIQSDNVRQSNPRKGSVDESKQSQRKSWNQWYMAHSHPNPSSYAQAVSKKQPDPPAASASGPSRALKHRDPLFGWHRNIPTSDPAQFVDSQNQEIQRADPQGLYAKEVIDTIIKPAGGWFFRRFHRIALCLSTLVPHAPMLGGFAVIMYAQPLSKGSKWGDPIMRYWGQQHEWDGKSPLPVGDYILAVPPSKGKKGFYIDAEDALDCPARYFNHPNNYGTPNAGFRVMPNGEVWVYALRRIMPGEEILVDYGNYKQAEDHSPTQSRSQSPELSQYVPSRRISKNSIAASGTVSNSRSQPSKPNKKVLKKQQGTAKPSDAGQSHTTHAQYRHSANHSADYEHKHTHTTALHAPSRKSSVDDSSGEISLASIHHLLTKISRDVEGLKEFRDKTSSVLIRQESTILALTKRARTQLAGSAQLDIDDEDIEDFRDGDIAESEVEAEPQGTRHTASTLRAGSSRNNAHSSSRSAHHRSKASTHTAHGEHKSSQSRALSPHSEDNNINLVSSDHTPTRGVSPARRDSGDWEDGGDNNTASSRQPHTNSSTVDVINVRTSKSGTVTRERTLDGYVTRTTKPPITDNPFGVLAVDDGQSDVESLDAQEHTHHSAGELPHSSPDKHTTGKGRKSSATIQQRTLNGQTSQ